jgi:hypothetical protein
MDTLTTLAAEAPSETDEHEVNKDFLGEHHCPENIKVLRESIESRKDLFGKHSEEETIQLVAEYFEKAAEYLDSLAINEYKVDVEGADKYTRAVGEQYRKSAERMLQISVDVEKNNLNEMDIGVVTRWLKDVAEDPSAPSVKKFLDDLEERRKFLIFEDAKRPILKTNLTEEQRAVIENLPRDFLEELKNLMRESNKEVLGRGQVFELLVKTEIDLVRNLNEKGLDAKGLEIGKTLMKILKDPRSFGINEPRYSNPDVVDVEFDKGSGSYVITGVEEVKSRPLDRRAYIQFRDFKTGLKDIIELLRGSEQLPTGLSISDDFSQTVYIPKGESIDTESPGVNSFIDLASFNGDNSEWDEFSEDILSKIEIRNSVFSIEAVGEIRRVLAEEVKV